MALSLYDPFFSRDLIDMQRQINQLFDRMAFPSTFNREMTHWRPTTDVYETDRELVVRTELPGLKKENVKVELCGNMLQICGERLEEKQEQNQRAHIRERSYGKFLRTIPVPQGTTENDIRADFNNGLLEVRVNKRTPQENRKQIEIKSMSA